MPNLLSGVSSTEIKLQDLAAKKIKILEIKIWSDLCSHKTLGFYRGEYSDKTDNFNFNVCCQC